MEGRNAAAVLGVVRLRMSVRVGVWAWVVLRAVREDAGCELRAWLAAASCSSPFRFRCPAGVRAGGRAAGGGGAGHCQPL